MDRFIYMTDSLRCTPETNTTLQIKYISIEYNFKSLVTEGKLNIIVIVNYPFRKK